MNKKSLIRNIFSSIVFLAPIKTFYKIYKEKSSDGYQSIPYVVTLLSASLQLYYGVLKANATMTIIISAGGVVIELAYLVLFSIYASTEEKIYTAKLMLFDIGGFGGTMALTLLLLKGQHRVNVVGWIYATFSLVAFAVPLSIMWRVIKTRSVEFMPFTTSLLVTLSAITWFFYGLVVKDLKIAVPNAVGLLVGLAQIILYMIYKYGNKKMEETNERNNP
ncbi:hypothetical protein ACJRO7_033013 [Eucalyptus globulus]|uniref:Bidirectional sugar transporter SWEET n=1 Tax=Eucalyptus globulus TaxID=34317 RepID=A0ABD3JJV6_EUCGL